ncbi:hypothetical protein ASN18_2188 [Candidatus Magnetominusculus xianensis]|uniref:Transposase n=1 Tax=Candidatus Magnetominusculus xianensis TaxID=1748249 RepID=A0ABR5SFR7_9BACT|nr:hypothetical protein ASN18_2188 [Candidatus Magnetominusculus xianensis]
MSFTHTYTSLASLTLTYAVIFTYLKRGLFQKLAETLGVITEQFPCLVVRTYQMVKSEFTGTVPVNS